VSLGCSCGVFFLNRECWRIQRSINICSASPEYVLNWVFCRHDLIWSLRWHCESDIFCSILTWGDRATLGWSDMCKVAEQGLKPVAVKTQWPLALKPAEKTANEKVIDNSLWLNPLLALPTGLT
jgi:hypothetical protein